VRIWLKRANFAAILVLSVAWAAHRLLDDGSVALVLLHAAAPFWGALGLVALGLAAAVRDAVAAALASGLVLVHALTVWPRPADPPAGPRGATITVASVNLFEHNDAPEAMLDELAAVSADVIALIELDDDWWARITADPRFDRWGWRTVDDRPDAFGIGLMSRLPFQSSEIVRLDDVPRVDAVIRVGVQGIPVSVVHVTPPYLTRWLPLWRRGLQALADPQFPAQIVAGDLNTTPFNPAFEGLRRAGWVDASEALGTRLTLTWPTQPFSLLGLDHVLVRGGIQVVRVERLPGSGSDHRGLLVTLRVPE